jgi:hydrogenase maturation protein HypF
VRRVAVRVDGVVQGVGFRPAVFVLAEELGVGGWVLNDARGVLAEVEGRPEAVARFVRELPARAPPLARIDALEVTERPPTGETAFAIRPSPGGGRADALVPADVATCAACLAEVLDAGDRRFRYPFTSCTACGPRFTIVTGVPYDRARTTMAGFAMCAACQAEYDDPRDRRFHAQPNACPDCGPRAVLHGAGGMPGRDAVAAAAGLLRDGAIVAVKGLGGFHLACRADDAAAVARLRARKHRDAKPFAVLAADLAAARELVELDTAAAALLASPEAPVVLGVRRPGAPVAERVAPGLRELGILLPSTPLHHLLARDLGVPLVLTSGNVSDEPIAFDDDDALERLGPIADAFLLHDRPIRTRTDDSVARVVRGAPVVLRRSRGWVPEATLLPVPAGRPLLAVGAELKSTFCVARGRRAWLGPHVGDLVNAATLQAFRRGIADLEAMVGVAPEVVAHDLHPDLLSTREAQDRDGVVLVAVQHHHAHLAAVLAEHGRDIEAVGAIFDGVGLGTDGTAWGGEILAGGLRGAARAAHLVPVALPGGDRAAHEPWRMACSWLVAAGIEDGVPPALAGAVDAPRWAAVARMCRTGFRAGPTSAMGRLFDAVAALCGLRAVHRFEGDAAMALEAAVDPGERGAYELPIAGELLDARPTVRAVARDVAAGVATGVVAARFHAAVARATADACCAVAGDRGLGTVVLSGGVFQNRRLVETTAALLDARGLEVLFARRVPPNDGGIALGQAVIAAAGMSA